MTGRLRRTWAHAPIGVRAPVSVVARTFHLYFEDGCGTYAAAIAYYAIFSLVPLSLVILSLFGLVVDRERIVRFVFDQVPLQETADVQESVDTLVRRAQQISVAGITFGLLALLWSASGIFAAVRRGLNAASHRQEPRAYWRNKLLDFALIPVLGALIILSIGMTATAQLVLERAGSIGPLNLDTNAVLQLTTYAVPAALSFVLFLLLYRLAPTVRPRWHEAVAGALFATVLFETVKNIYARAIAVTPYSTDTAIYAGFGTALIFLFWMFINASILLLGAEFARALSMARPGPQSETQASVLPGPARSVTPEL